LANQPPPIHVDLDLADFRRLVAGRAIVRGIAGHRVEIRMPGLSARAMLKAVTAAMGDDPIEAQELNQPRPK
jgi:hypothetical protein